jgi:peptide/nickel transport system substrate-binding protein
MLVRVALRLRGRETYRIGEQCLSILFLECLFFLISLTAYATEAPDTVDKNNRLVICIQEDVESMDPVSHRSRNTQIVLKNIFDSLTARDVNNRVVPQLASGWRNTSDTEWEFTLRKGVRFHNGDNLTASDVVFTLNRVINPSFTGFPSSPRKGLFVPVKEVHAMGDYTVVIKTAYPWPNLPLMLSLQEIVPEKHMKEAGYEGFNEKPIGTGPYKFAGRKKGVEIILESFNDYYGGPPELPPVQAAPVKHLVFRVVPSYIEQISMLKKGDCNIIFNIPSDLIPVVRMSKDVAIQSIPATRSVFAELNLSRPYLKDERVRRALNHAVDVETIIKQKFMGKGQRLSTIFLPNTTGFDPGLAAYTYDPQTAKRLLIEANFPYGQTILIYTNQSELLFADGISLYLTKLGIKNRVKVVRDARPDMIGANAPWDIFAGSWGNSTLDPVDIIDPKLTGRGSANYSGFISDELDMIMEKVQKTMSPSLRKEYFERVQRIIFDGAPMIFGYGPDEFYAVTSNVKNFHPSLSGMVEMHDVILEETER